MASDTDERIAVIGVGYVGLPLALDLVDAGFRVHAVDAADERVRRLQSGDSYIDGVDSSRLRAALASGRLNVTDTSEGWEGESVAFICVPTPLTPSREPDLGPILAAASYVRQGLRDSDLVILQSTTFPGTTVGPLRQALESTGRCAGRDFDLAFAPERISPGDGRRGTSIPRIVGGIDKASSVRAARILELISPSVMVMTSPDSAELAKLFENVFRNVNIALVNELALISERLGLDVWEVLSAASTKPFGFMLFTPGPGVGGHCIPVDPYYLASRARSVGFGERFIEAAADINTQMPNHVVQLVTTALNTRGKAVRGSKILVIGVAFKPNVSDDRNSPAGPIILELTAAGAIVEFHDPRIPYFSVPSGGLIEPMRSRNLDEALRASPDCVVIVTPHAEIPWDRVFASANLVVDTRNASAGFRIRPGQVLRLGAGWS